ncbi:MAG: TPRREGION domain-containing protein [Nitrospira sp.]|nr:MAG: TPRREGION domain-containing protein [Nitrospira sp.]
MTAPLRHTSMNVLSAIPLIVISALVIFSPLQEGGTTHVAQMIVRLVILAWVGGAMAWSIHHGRLEVPIVSIRYAVLAFLGFAAVATIFSPYAHPSRQWLFMIIGYALFFYLLVSSVDRWEHVHVLAVVIVMMGVGEAALAILQSLAWNVVRPSGTFFNPNFLAGYLAVSWAILLSNAVYGYRREAAWSWTWMPPALWWLGIAASLCSLFFAVLLTQSRGGMIVLLISTVFVLTIRYGWRLAGTCIVALMMAGLLFPTPLRERVLVEHEQNPVSYARWQMWQGAIAQMADHPFGIGLGLYQYTYPLYAFPVEGEIARYGKVAQTPHNDYLQMGVEMGVGAVVVFAAGVLMLARELIQVLRSRLSRRQRSLIIGVGGAGIGLLVHAALDSSLRESALALLLALCAGLIVVARRLSNSSQAVVHHVPVRSRWVWGIGTTCLLLLGSVEVIRPAMAWMIFDSASRRAMAGETASAIQGLQMAIAWDPGKSLYHHGLGSVYARAFETSRAQNSFRLAEEEFKTAIELNPLDSRLLGLLAQLYVSAAQSSSGTAPSLEQRKNWLRAALQVYERAVQLAPYSAPHRYEQARLHWMLGERAAAEQKARGAERLEPNFLPARALLARVWMDQGHADEAKHELQEIESRQDRYKQWSKNSIDQAFLNVDVAPLRAAMQEKDVAG